MTYVVRESVNVDTPGSDVASAYSNGRLIVTVGSRSVTFSVDTQAGAARVVEDMHQPESVSPTEIPPEVRDHVLRIGYRIHGSTIDDGGFQLFTGDSQ